MGFFRTKDPKTGEPRLGAGVYLILCAAMIGGVILWHARQNAHDPVLGRPSTQSSQPVNPTNVAPVAQAAEEHKSSTATDVPGVSSGGSAREYAYGEQPGTDTAPAATATSDTDNLDTIQNTVELLRENKERAEREKAEAVARAQAEANAKIAELKKKALVTSTAENAPIDGRPATPVRADNQSGVDINAAALVVFDAKRDIRPVSTSTSTAAAPTGFDTDRFLPRGFFFPVYLLTTIQTVNQEDIVVLGVAENVIFQHKVQLPFGTRLLGSASGSSFEDRVSVNVDTILYPDGRELPISAFLKDASDLSSGVKGYYIPQPLRVQLTPYINEFIASWTQAATQRYSGSRDNNDGLVSLAGAEQSANLIREQANRIQQRLDRRYPEKVVVPIGTKAFVQLRSPLDLTRARVGGSLSNTQPILPGYENNPISPSGVVERAANRPATGQLTSNSGQTPLPSAEAPAPANASAQQAQNYLNALGQLNAMERQLQTSRNARNTSKPGSNTRINWPSGDIE